MDLMEHKQGMIKLLLDMLKRSSADEVDKHLHPEGGIKVDSVKVLGPEDAKEEEMSDMGVSPNVPEREHEGGPAIPFEEEKHPEEEPEDIPAIARLRRRK